MHMETDAALGEFVGLGIGVNAVREENVDEVVVGVTPEDSARKPLMSVSLAAGSGWLYRAFHFVAGCVEAQTSALAAVQYVSGSKQLYGLLLEELDAIVGAAVH